MLHADSVYLDWAITAAFYSAVHLVEAAFARRFGWHGEIHGGASPHVWRLQQLRSKQYTLFCWQSYNRLYIASRRVRYLESWKTSKGTSDTYYLPEQAGLMIESDLAVVKTEMGY